jgi:hypothetical protein
MTCACCPPGCDVAPAHMLSCTYVAAVDMRSAYRCCQSRHSSAICERVTLAQLLAQLNTSHAVQSNTGASENACRGNTNVDKRMLLSLDVKSRCTLYCLQRPTLPVYCERRCAACRRHYAADQLNRHQSHQCESWGHSMSLLSHMRAPLDCLLRTESGLACLT